ncbi:MAG: metal-dependent transcriptional regulator [Clostridia bacterium]|nr:metal-dependent transcriptional regulator [Clostridia bacterium]
MKPDTKSEKTTEDYLEAMLVIKQKNGYVRSIDVAQHLGVTKPSVTYTTKRLKEKGYIVMDKDNYISITDSGMEIAEKILNRHNTLSAFFISIGVNEETAKEDACKIEHDISAETFNALCKYIEKNKERG